MKEIVLKYWVPLTGKMITRLLELFLLHSFFFFIFFFLSKKGQTACFKIFSADNETENVDLQNAFQNLGNQYLSIGIRGTMNFENDGVPVSR